MILLLHEILILFHFAPIKPYVHWHVRRKDKVIAHAGHRERRKLACFEHVTHHDTVTKIIIQGTVEGKRSRGRQIKSWTGNVNDWTECSIAPIVHGTENSERWWTLDCWCCHYDTPTIHDWGYRLRLDGDEYVSLPVVYSTSWHWAEGCTRRWSWSLTRCHFM